MGKAGKINTWGHDDFESYMKNTNIEIESLRNKIGEILDKIESIQHNRCYLKDNGDYEKDIKVLLPAIYNELGGILKEYRGYRKVKL